MVTLEQAMHRALTSQAGGHAATTCRSSGRRASSTSPRIDCCAAGLPGLTLANWLSSGEDMARVASKPFVDPMSTPFAADETAGEGGE